MKKNLLFALSVFVITLVGLLVFADSSNEAKQETSKVENIEMSNETKDNLVSLNQ